MIGRRLTTPVLATARRESGRAVSSAKNRTERADLLLTPVNALTGDRFDDTQVATASCGHREFRNQRSLEGANGWRTVCTAGIAVISIVGSACTEEQSREITQQLALLALALAAVVFGVGFVAGYLFHWLVSVSQKTPVPGGDLRQFVAS